MFLSYSFLFFSFIISQKMIGKGNDDFAVYIKMLIKGGYPSWEDKPYDFFFWLIAKIVYSITGNESLFIFIICCLSFIPFFIFFLDDLKDITKSPKISYCFFIFFSVLFVCSMSFWNLYGNYLRQAWVMSFSLGAIVSLNYGKTLKPLLWAGLALVSHSTGIIVLAAVIAMLLTKKINKKIIINVLLIAGLVLLLINPLHLIMPFLPGNISSKLGFYLSWHGLSFGVVATLRIALLTIALLFFNAIYERMKKDSIALNFLLILSIYCFICLSIAGVPKAVERMYYPTMIWFFLFLSRIMALYYCSVYQKQTNRIVINLTIVPLIFAFFFISLQATLTYNVSYYSGDLNDFIFYTPLS
ncbi:hypothetical protein C3402_24110 [Pantoea sp. PSNIH3]|nr:hypothetical protein C3402_24110 [Pantoea sp. PSNIH3]